MQHHVQKKSSGRTQELPEEKKDGRSASISRGLNPFEKKAKELLHWTITTSWSSGRAHYMPYLIKPNFCMCHLRAHADGMYEKLFCATCFWLICMFLCEMIINFVIFYISEKRSEDDTYKNVIENSSTKKVEFICPSTPMYPTQTLLMFPYFFFYFRKWECQNVPSHHHIHLTIIT